MPEPNWIPKLVEIAQLREVKGLSQSQLGALARTGRKAVERSEAGTPMWKETLEKIAAALGVSVETIGGPPSQYSREECQKNCLELISGSTGRLTIRTIALDLSAGDESIIYTVNHSKAETLSIEILVLADGQKMPRQIPVDVRKWGDRATVSIARLAETLGGRHSAREFDLTVKRYTTKPSIHGVWVEVVQGLHRKQRYYLTECQKSEPIQGLPALLSGDGQYLIADDPPLPGRAKRFVNKFKQLFAKQWATTDTVLRYTGTRLEFNNGNPLQTHETSTARE